MSASVRIVADTRLEGLHSLQARVAALKESQVLVGIPAGKTEPDGTSTAQVGAWMEYGVPSRNIPERPWLRKGMNDNLPYFRAVNRASLAQVLDGRMSASIALDTLGVAAVAKVKDGIVKGPWAPNAPATVARKGSDKPLIDTAQMLSSVGHVVVPAGSAT